MRNNRIRGMMYGAMIAALYGAIFFIDLYLGNTIGYFAYFILPSLILYYAHHYGIKQTLVVSVVIFFLVLFTGSPASLFYAITSVIAGIALAYGHQKKVKDNTMVFISIGISLLNNILTYTLLSKILEVDLIDELTEAYEMFSGIFEVGISLETYLQFGGLFIVLLGFVEGYLLLMTTSLIVPRLNIQFKYNFNFLTMQLPVWFGIVAILATAASFFVEHIYFTYVNVIIIFLICLQGFSLIAFYFVYHRKIFLYFLSIITFIFAIGFVPVRVIYFIIGIADILFGMKTKIMYNVKKK